MWSGNFVCQNIPTEFIFVVPGVQNAGKQEYALQDIP
jgi:hypothetical protein